jgi:hypothetical protein
MCCYFFDWIAPATQLHCGCFRLLGTAFDVYLSAGSYVHAVRIAMRLQSAERVQQAMSACTETKKRQQLALIVGSQRFGAHGVDDEALAPLLGNTLV